MLKKILPVILVIILTVSVGLGGYYLGVGNSTENDGQRLNISAVVDKDARFTLIPEDELGGNFDSNITYLNLTDVFIHTGKESMKLEDAIRDGVVSVEEITAWARLDARKGLCSETSITKHGLTKFVYQYPDIQIELIYDIYATPDGREHAISSLFLCAPGESSWSSPYFSEEGFNYPIDREDWGLQITVTDTSPTGITLKCSQFDGQQIGQLEITDYMLMHQENYELVPRIGNGFTPISITMGEESEVKIDWSAVFPSLSTGEYYLHLDIADIYDAADVHPLMENYYDQQEYYIPFVIS